RSLNVEPYRINTNDLKYIDREFHLRLRKSSLKPGDIVIVRTGKPGACAVVPEWLEEANCSDVVIVRAGPSIRAAYISYVVNFVALHHIDSHTVGAVQQHFNVGAARQIKFGLPSLNEQDRILAILGALDDKIELNRRMNETLEAMARVIFKDWFVDFGPTRAKLSGAKPYLTPDLWSLFPARLNDKGLPEGWEMGLLSDFSDLQNGYAFKSTEWQAEGVPVVKIGSVKPAVVDLDQVSFVSSELACERQDYRLSAGDILVGLTGYVGETGRVPPTDNPPLLNQRVARFIPNRNCYALVYACVRDRAFKEFAEGQSHGSAQANVSTRNLMTYPLNKAPENVISAYAGLVDPLLAMGLSNLGEMSALAALRDLLLPKLMSGEIRIRDAEKLVGEAV
ncbi:MAG: hypothetical protein HOO99_15425, partial [Hyphomicrobiaceae bacterium]|nr:hypothetical protein [Hyphomicrobiaceae bacterium]